MTENNGNPVQTGLSSTISKILKDLLKKLVFESTWDFLKARFLAFLLFIVGNFLGFFVPEKRPLYLPLNLIGDYFEGYAFLTLVFDRFRSDASDRYALVFDPPTLEQMRVCKELYLEEPPEGPLLIERLAAEYPSCLTAQETRNGATATIKIGKPPTSTALISVQRDGKTHWFCGCEERVINAFLKDKRNP